MIVFAYFVHMEYVVLFLKEFLYFLESYDNESKSEYVYIIGKHTFHLDWIWSWKNKQMKEKKLKQNWINIKKKKNNKRNMYNVFKKFGVTSLVFRWLLYLLAAHV